MNLLGRKITENKFFWWLNISAILFFWLNWGLVFFVFSADFSDGFFSFLVVLFGGILLSLLVILFEEKKPFAWLVMVLGNFLPWWIFCLLCGAGVFTLAFFSLLAGLFFYSGRKRFQKESANQIKTDLSLTLKGPYKGIAFALAVLFALAFYFVGFFQEKISAEQISRSEEIFGPAIEQTVSFWKQLVPGGEFSEKLSLEMTIDEYIKKNLPPQDQSLVGKNVQLEDGRVVVFDRAMLNELEKSNIENTRKQLSSQFSQSLKGDEKLFQVIGMIIDQKASLLLSSSRKIWPGLEPILFAKAVSVFFIFVWLSGILRWPILKLTSGATGFLVGRDLAEKKTRLVEKEEWFLKG